MSILNSPLAKIGLGFATGGIGGAALGALSSSNSPAGRAASMGSMANNIYKGFGSADEAQPTPNADWAQNNFGGQDFSDQFGAMKRRLGGGGF